jgi:hypothetical protein
LEPPGQRHLRAWHSQDHFPNFNRFAQIGKKKSLAARLEEERRLMALEEVTILELEQN